MSESGHGHGAPAPADQLLIRRLDQAVTQVIAELTQMPATARRQQLAAWTGATPAQHVAERGDAIRYGGKPDEIAATFSILARGLVALAHSPGGVRFMGRHWCVDHGLCERTEREALGEAA